MKKINLQTTKNAKEETIPVNQVMVLFESLRSDIQLLAKNFSSFRDSITVELREFKQEMYRFKEEMDCFKEQTNGNFKLVFEYFSRIEDEMLEIKAEMKGLDGKRLIRKNWMNSPNGWSVWKKNFKSVNVWLRKKEKKLGKH